mgnify:CR=1 FL=1
MPIEKSELRFAISCKGITGVKGAFPPLCDWLLYNQQWLNVNIFFLILYLIGETNVSGLAMCRVLYEHQQPMTNRQLGPAPKLGR